MNFRTTCLPNLLDMQSPSLGIVCILHMATSTSISPKTFTGCPDFIPVLNIFPDFSPMTYNFKVWDAIKMPSNANDPLPVYGLFVSNVF